MRDAAVIDVSPLRRWSGAVAQITGLWAVVVALPILDVLRRAPEFFVAHRADALDLLALTVLLLAAGPLALGAMVALSMPAGRKAADLVTAGIVGLLIGVFATELAYRAGVESWAATLAIALAGAAGSALMWWRSRAVRHALTVLAAAALVVPLVFFSGRDIRSLLHSAVVDVSARGKTGLPPVVLVVFDELPLVSLVGEQGQIDGVRYPNFAALAADGVWFRNATTVSDYTRWALPAILTGRYPEPASMPTASDHPHSVFTALASTHRMEVFEPLTAVCPPQLNATARETRSVRTRRMLADVQVVAAHVLLPPDARVGLPDVTQDWAGFADDDDDQVRRRWKRGERTDPSTIASSFIEAIGADDAQPTLYFLHTLVSHHPPRRLPSGQGIANFVTPPGMRRGMVWTTSSWPVAQFQQGALVQAGLADTVIGRLRTRLQQTGLYDRTLIVVTADHGISFTPGSSIRDFSEAGAAGIVPVPLIVKLPAGRQRLTAGTVDDRNVETIDILPTIADALGVSLVAPTDGTSALRSAGPRSQKRVYFRHARETRAYPSAEMARLRDIEIARKVATFGRGPWPAPILPGADSLVGRPLASLTIDSNADVPGIQVDNLHALEDVDPSAPMLPVQVKGRLLGPTRADAASVFLAIALNDTIAATTRTWSEEGRWMALLPPDRLRRGRNTLEVFVFDPVRPMTLAATRANRRLPRDLDLFSPEAPRYGVAYKGFHHLERAGSTAFHWTSAEAAITVPVAPGFSPSSLEVDVLFTGRAGKRLRILLDDCELLSESLPGGRWTHAIPLGTCRPRGRWATVRFLAETHRPARDARRLGVAIARVVLR